MRKIISKESEQKKTRRNQFLVGGILILVMFASLLGYAFNKEQGDSTEKIIHNGFTFTKESGFWNLKIESLLFSFRHSPKEAEIITAALNPLGNYKDKPLYVYSENPEATSEIYRNLFYQNRIVLRMQDACLEEKDCTGNVPLKNCTDNFVIIKESPTIRIAQEDKCVFIEGNQANLTRLSDSFLFKLIGVQ